MAFPSVTYSFTNGTTADATQVNTNNTDLINGASDGTKDYNISALTASGTATLNGNVTLGNGSVDDITITGSIAASIAIKTTYSYDLGSSTVGWKSFYLGSSDSAARTVRVIGGVIATSYTLTLPTAAGTAGTSVVTTGSGTLAFESRMASGDVYNLGMSLAAGVFTITDALGSTLSATNKGKIVMASTTAGQTVALDVTAPATINDDTHASSHFTNYGWGITESVDWATNRPFFIYAINRGNTAFDGVDGSSMFCIALSPWKRTTPSASTSIGDTGAIPATDDQHGIIILGDVTIANYTSLPMQLTGVVQMQWVTSTDDWTIQTLATNNSGIGPTAIDHAFKTEYTMPAGQHGANSGAFLIPNGGTAPSFSTNGMKYYINRDGEVCVLMTLSGDGGTDGAGAAATFNFCVPYLGLTASQMCPGVAFVTKTGGNEIGFMSVGASVLTGQMYGADSVGVFYDQFGNGARTVTMGITYKPGI